MQTATFWEAARECVCSNFAIAFSLCLLYHKFEKTATIFLHFNSVLFNTTIITNTYRSFHGKQVCLIISHEGRTFLIFEDAAVICFIIVPILLG